MDHEILQRVMCCPSCKGALSWEKRRCAFCGRPFDEARGIINFIDPAGMTVQDRYQMELHREIAPAYRKRYSTPFATLFSEYWNDQYLSRLPPERETILDCGCGAGPLARALLDRGKTVFGLDVSPAMLAMAREITGENPRSTFVACSAAPLPFRDAVFDAVCFRGALHHMENEMAALGEARRVLKNEGLLLLSEPNDDSLILRIPRRLANRFSKRFGGDHKAFRSRPWLAAIESSGFRIFDARYFSFFSQPLCGMSDIIPLMKYMPFPERIAAWLIRLDEICSRLPLIKKQGFDLFVAAKKVNRKK